MIFQGAARYPVTEIVVHCTATRPRWNPHWTVEQVRDEIRRWHVHERGWRDIGYHRVGGRCGRVALGRSLWTIGAHVVERNRGTLGYALAGGHGSSSFDRFSDHFTEAQRYAFESWVREVAELTDLRKLSGHNEFANKACPGFNVRREFDLKRILREK